MINIANNEYKMLSFSIESKVLQGILSNIYSVVEKKSIVPILSNILLDITQEKIKFLAINLDMSIVQHCSDAQIFHPGSVTVNATIFHEIISKLSGLITIAEKENILHIKTATSKFQLTTLPANLFPAEQNAEFEDSFEIESSNWHYLLHNCVSAMANDRSKQYLNGIFLHFDKEKKLRAVATDGHRLICTIDEEMLECENKNALNLIFPRKTVFEIIKIIKNIDQKIQFFFAKNGVKLIIDQITIFSKVLEGSFPSYQSIVSEQNKYTFSVDREILRTAIARVSLLSPEKTKTILLDFNFEKNVLQISAACNEFGSADEEMNIETEKYEKIQPKIGLNSSYIIEMLGNLIGEKIQICFDDELGPIRFIDTVHAENIYIVMPVRV